MSSDFPETLTLWPPPSDRVKVTKPAEPRWGGEFDFGFECTELWDRDDLNGYVRNTSQNQDIDIQWYEDIQELPDGTKRKYWHAGERTTWTQPHRLYT